MNKCQRSQRLELGRCEDLCIDIKEGDGQDGMGTGAEEERLGTPPAAQGLAVHDFASLKIQGDTHSPCIQLDLGGQLPPSQQQPGPFYMETG